VNGFQQAFDFELPDPPTVTPAPPPAVPSGLNRYQSATSESKLRGQYYTPRSLVTLMVERLRLAEGDLVVDPSCGDGSFLCGVVEGLARRDPSAAAADRAADWARQLVGFDINPVAVAEARENLRQCFRQFFGADLPLETFGVRRGDALAHPTLPSLLDAIQWRAPTPPERLLVLGNPPYVEAKRLDREAKAALRERFPDAVSGAPDLYLYFLYACLNWLRPGDRLAFVLPNKLMVNANAQAVRERLLDRGQLRELWFATLTRLFEEAKVYPVVLFAGGPEPAEAARVRHVHLARQGDALSVARAQSLPAHSYRLTESAAFFPLPADPELEALLERMLEEVRVARLADVLDLKWSVSFHRAGLRERYVMADRPLSPHARRFLGGGAFAGNGEVRRYRLEWAGWWIDYNEVALRREGNGLPRPGLFEAPKVVICQNGRSLRAALDTQGFVLKDTFLCGRLRESSHPLVRRPRALVGLLCSRLTHFFYSHVFHGGHVNGGYLHFLRSFLVDVPLGRWTDELAADVEAAVLRREQAPDLDAEVAGGAIAGTIEAVEQVIEEEIEEEIEERIAAAFHLTPGEQQALREWAAQDPNWPARERTRDITRA
jgi:hypothetical protein